MIEGKPRCVIVANGVYVKLPSLNRAVSDAEELRKTLEATHLYPTEMLQNFERGALLDRIDQHLGNDALIDGSLILVWIGHGAVGADHSLRMIVRSGQQDVQAADAGNLGEWVARTGARQGLVVIDTCYSGAGVVDAAKLANAVNSGRASPEKAWFGVIAASLGDEPARNGALIRGLISLLRDGPRDPDFRWDRTRPYIRGDDVLNALVEDWSEERQRPHKLSVGRPWDFIRNPRFEVGVPEQPVEHLLQAARGGSGEESYFTGREAKLAEIVTWLAQDRPGLLVLTGPPGCGKSAIAGRIASLSSSIERARLLAAAIVPTELDPGAGCVDGQLQVRGLTIELAAELLARQLGLDVNEGVYGILAEARRRRQMNDPFVIIVDGLDEAGAYCGSLAAEFIAPIAREALVLVATRDVPVGDKTLISLLGPAALLLDLGQDVDGTRQDIANYVQRRLAGVAPSMEPCLVAEELASRGASNAPQFLLARLVTSQLRERPVDTADDDWRLTLATTVESALERDLQSVVLTIAEKPHPTAAREMLCALSLAYGGGFPADELWPAVATAISPTSTSYTREDVYQILTLFGRHLVAGTDGEQPVYRIAHQSLTDYVRGNVTLAGDEQATLEKVATVVFAQYAALLDDGYRPQDDPYLWRFAWRHLAEAGSRGLADLRRLVERDRVAFLPDLTSALDLSSHKSLTDGRTLEALALTQEAVGHRRELGNDLALAMALFSLTFVQSAAGDQAGADETAAEAAKLARAAGDSPEARAVLGATMLARSHSLLANGHLQSASVLAQEAVNLTEAGGVENPYAMSAAYGIKGRVAFAQGDVRTAIEACHRAVDLVDEHGDADLATALKTESLSILATIEANQSIMSFVDASGPAVMPTAERMLQEYRAQGSYGTIIDIPVSCGIQAYVRARINDRLRGFEAPELNELRSLLEEAIGLVRPFAAQVVAATFALAEGAMISLQLDATGAASDCAQAEDCLRPMTESNDGAAFLLGQLLDTANAPLMAPILQGAGGDVSAVLERQREAVMLLSKSNLWVARIALARALSRLSFLFSMGLGDPDQASAIRSDGIEVWRELVGKVPDASFQLVALLCDQVARLIETRPGEAVDMAREALSEAEKLPQPQYAELFGVTETNLAGALLAAMQPQESIPAELRGLVERAVKRLEPLVPHPVYSGALAVAHLNLGQVELLDRHFDKALEAAEMALAMLDAPGVIPVHLLNRPKVLLVLGRAQRETGQVELGTQTLRDEIERLRATATDLESGGAMVLAGALNIAAPEFWDEMLESFSEQPGVQRILSSVRLRPPSEMLATVDALIDALDAADNTQQRSLRQIARLQRARAPDEFDAAWLARVGSIDRWLKLDQNHEWQVMAWWNTQSWRLSRDYLMTHPVLLHEDTDIVLQEFAFEDLGGELADRHRDLLRDSRQIGIEAAYGPLLKDIAIQHWMRSEDPVLHLAEHGELLQPEITTLLLERATNGDAASAVFVAILDLAHRGEHELASQAISKPNSMFDQLRAAWRSSDISRLISLATIVQGATDDVRMMRISTLALAIGHALEHPENGAEPVNIAALEGNSDGDRNELVAMIVDAMQHHPTSAPQLARLIRVISG